MRHLAHTNKVELISTKEDAPLQGKVVIRNFAGPDANRKLDIVQRIRYRRFVDLLKIFEFEW